MFNREAVIVSVARTPIGKAYRGAFNDTQPQELGGHVIASAVRRAGVAPEEIDDVVLGCALQQGGGARAATGSSRCASAAVWAPPACSRSIEGIGSWRR
jgi:acetyl-CoA C-acetyltransferase